MNDFQSWRLEQQLMNLREALAYQQSQLRQSIVLSMISEHLERPVTNADRTRAKSDEELAELLNWVETEGRAYGPRGKAAWLDWLREEAT